MTEVLFAEFWKYIELDAAIERVCKAALEGVFDKWLPYLVMFGMGYVVAKAKIL
jgi:hypothetical protein